MEKYYLAYGSNLNLSQMKYRCPNSKLLGTAVINDYELLFKGSGTGSYLTIEKKEGSKVPVAVWKVTESDIDSLDMYEGYPTFYYKKDMPIVYTGIKSGRQYKQNAFVYIMHEERKLGRPSEYYMNTCKEGYRAFGFDAAYLEAAYKKSSASSK